MDKEQRHIPATELRIHLGEALRALDEEDLVIEKGGVPVAMLVKYERSNTWVSSIETEYERACSKRAEPGGWERMEAAMNSGWVGGEGAEIEASVYRSREAGRTSRRLSLDENEEPVVEDDGSEDASRQRYMYPRHEERWLRVGEERGPTNTP